MEAVGPEFGAAPRLIELFKQTINAYKLFLEGQHTEKSMAHFIVRLGIEERRLIQWGETSGFSQQGGDMQPIPYSQTNPHLLQNNGLLAIVENVFKCIIDIFGDRDSLKKQYGLEFKDSWSGSPHLTEPCQITHLQHDDGTAIENPTTIATSPKKRSLPDRLLGAKKIKTGVVRFKWVVKDKDQFEKLLAGLKGYNDSLYSLHPPENSHSMSRDALTSLIRTADMEFLGLLKTLPDSDPAVLQSSQLYASTYGNVVSTASIAFEVRTNIVGNKISTGTGVDSTQKTQLQIEIIPETELELPLQIDKRLNRLFYTTRKKTTRLGTIITHLVLEKMTDQMVLFFPRDCPHEKRLASLLKHTRSSTATFRHMEFVGIVKRQTDSNETVYFAYKSPSGVNPGIFDKDNPMSLAHLLINADIKSLMPALDDRFKLAASLASAVYHLHSSEWMHKRLSPGGIIFSPDVKPTATSYFETDLRSPFLIDLEPMARLGYTNRISDVCYRSPTKLEDIDIYVNPSYLFKKFIGESQIADGNSPASRTYHRFRHDYYALGLILLQIGCWAPFSKMPMLMNTLERALEDGKESERQKIWKEYVHCTAAETFINEDEPRGRLMVLGSASEEAQKSVESLNRAIEKEKLHDRIDFESLHSVMNGQACFWDHWTSNRIYIPALVQQEAINVANSSLASSMGRSYQQLVLCCLNSDFDLPADAGEPEWLRAFNWQVVKELEKFCV